MSGVSPSRKTLPLRRKLKSRKKIALLFKEGTFEHKYPLGLMHMLTEDESQSAPPYKIAFSVPRKKFRKAVHRNLLRRRMSEAFRIHQDILPGNAPQKHGLLLMFIYQSNKQESFQIIEKAVIQLLKKVSKGLENH